MRRKGSRRSGLFSKVHMFGFGLFFFCPFTPCGSEAAVSIEMFVIVNFAAKSVVVENHHKEKVTHI